jgi:hypothetical protein
MNDYIKFLEDKNRRLHEKLWELEKNNFNGDKLISGGLILANVPTANGRIYTTDVMKEMVDILNEKAKIGRCWVVTDGDGIEIQLDKIGACVLKNYFYNDGIYAHIKKVDTYSGDVLYKFLNMGLGFLTPMTIGTVNGFNNIVEIEDVRGYRLCTKGA